MGKKRSWLIGVIYCIGIFYFVFKASYYYQEVDWGPDVRAHISYIYYETKQPFRFVPQLEKIYQMDLNVVGEKAYVLGETSDVCYLCHPPLYYKLMALTGCVKEDKRGQYIDMNRIHIANLFLAMAGILLCLSFGRKKIEQMGDKLLFHFLFVSIVITLPMISYIASGPTNDNLLYLIAGIYLYGVDRGVAGKRDIMTYAVIALSVCMAVLTKLTLGMMVVSGLVVVAAYIMWHERSIKLIWNRSFLLSTPIYLPALYYFIRVKLIYGTFQPSLAGISWESFSNSEFSISKTAEEWYVAGIGELAGLSRLYGLQRFQPFRMVAGLVADVEGSVAKSLGFFWERFWETWSMVYTHTVQQYKHGTFAEAIFWVSMVVLVGFLITRLIDMIRGKLAYEELTVFSLCIGSLIAFLYHLVTTVRIYYNGGRLGGYQARYYICCIACFALGNVYLLRDSYSLIGHRFRGRWRRVAKIAIHTVVLLFCFALYYFDFYYFLRSFHLYRNFL